MPETAISSTPSSTTTSLPNLPLLLGSAVAFAEADWQSGTSEEDTEPGSRLAQIFCDSGYSNGVDYDDDGRIVPWCGLSVSAWLVRAGLSRLLRRSFFHVLNVRDFLSYSRSPTKRERTKNKVVVNGRLIWLEDYHEQLGARRIWQDFEAVQEAELSDLDVQPGYIVLFKRARYPKNGHITLVRSWNPQKGVLETLEGNAAGYSADGTWVHDSVVVKRRDLSDPDVREEIVGIGCVSACDALDLDYRS